MQRRRIEIGAVGPDEGVNLGINAYLIEHGQVAQRPIQLAAQDRFEVDELFRRIVKLHAQRIGRHDLE